MLMANIDDSLSLSVSLYARNQGFYGEARRHMPRLFSHFTLYFNLFLNLPYLLLTYLLTYSMEQSPS